MKMVNLGSINGKVEILREILPDTKAGPPIITLIARSNRYDLTDLEALDLADVLSYAVTGNPMPKCDSFIPNGKEFEC